MQRKKSAFSLAAILICTAFLTGACSAQISVGKAPLTLNELAGKSLNGAWKYNAQESDNPLEKARAAFQSQSAASSGAAKPSTEQNEVAALSVSFFPPDALVLIVDETSATINENYEEIVQTRTVLTDGKARLFKLTAADDFSVAANAAGNRLVIETRSPRGNRLAETYELSADGGKLKARLLISDAVGRELLSLRRVYDRAALDVFTGDVTDFQ